MQNRRLMHRHKPDQLQTNLHPGRWQPGSRRRPLIGDVRPAATEIVAATRSDDLAPAAIEAAGRLANKEAQQALADAVLAGGRACRRAPS